MLNILLNQDHCFEGFSIEGVYCWSLWHDSRGEQNFFLVNIENYPQKLHEIVETWRAWIWYQGFEIMILGNDISSKTNAFKNFLDMLLLILHSLQIVQILDLVLCLVKSLNTSPLSLDIVVTIVCQHLLRCLLLYFLQDLCHFYIHSNL